MENMDDSMLIHDGFPGQRLRVLARPALQTALTRPVTRAMLITDVGYFPHAVAHGRNRPSGTASAIVILCVAGRGHLQMGSRSWPIVAGQATVIPANTPHVYRADSRNPWTIWWMHVEGSASRELVDSVHAANGSPVLAVKDVVSTTALIDEALSAYEEEETLATVIAGSGIAWHLLTQLASQRPSGGPSSVDRIDLIRTYIREHFTSRIYLEDLAQLVSLSPSHLAAIFKADVGMSVSEYIKRQRSAKARELLVTTDHSIAHIGRLVGYADPLYFTRQFTSVNGMSPRKFRASR